MRLVSRPRQPTFAAALWLALGPLGIAIVALQDSRADNPSVDNLSFATQTRALALPACRAHPSVRVVHLYAWQLPHQPFS